MIIKKKNTHTYKQQLREAANFFTNISVEKNFFLTIIITEKKKKKKKKRKLKIENQRTTKKKKTKI